MCATFGSETRFFRKQSLKAMCVRLAATCERHSNNFGRSRNTFKGVFSGGSKNKVRLVFAFAVDEKYIQAPFCFCRWMRKNNLGPVFMLLCGTCCGGGNTVSLRAGQQTPGP